MEITRRSLFGKTLQGAAIGAALTDLKLFASESQAPTRAYSGSKYCLTIENQFAGWISSLDGGGAVSAAVAAASSKDIRQPGMHFDDMTLQFGADMSKPFLQWVKDTVENRPATHNGAVYVCDFNDEVHSQLSWERGLINEVRFPACDAAAKDLSVMSVRFNSGVVRFGRPSKMGQRAPGTPSLASAKKWLPPNFRLQVDGCQRGSASVTRIEPIVIKNVAGRSQLQPLAFSVAESQADDFYKWWQDSALGGGTAQRNASLAYLNPDLKTALFVLEFPGAAISRICNYGLQAGEQIHRLQFEMVSQGVVFKFGSTA